MIAWRDIEVPAWPAVDLLLQRLHHAVEPAAQDLALRLSEHLAHPPNAQPPGHGSNPMRAAQGQAVGAAASRTAPLLLLEAAAAREALRCVAGSSLEQGGLLLGQAYGFGAGRAGVALVHISAAVASVERESSALSLRMQAAVWSAARERLAPGERVVGWFHSHPGIGAFFSDTDRRTQAAFFREDHSVGWVIDPLLQQQAWFMGATSEPVAATAVWVVDTAACVQLPG